MDTHFGARQGATDGQGNQCGTKLMLMIPCQHLLYLDQAGQSASSHSLPRHAHQVKTLVGDPYPVFINMYRCGRVAKAHIPFSLSTVQFGNGP